MSKDNIDITVAQGIGLKESEWTRIDNIAEELDANRHAISVWAMRDFIRRYDAGEIPLVVKPRLPGL